MPPAQPVARPHGNTSSATSPERADLPMPPMGMPPQDGPTLPSRGDGPPRMNPEQEPPPGSYLPGYGGPPYHAAYPPPPQGSYPPASFGQGGYPPPYGYPPHMHGYNYGAPPYGYGYGGYPTQQAQSHPAAKDKTRRKSPSRRSAKTSPTRSSSAKVSALPHVHGKVSDEIEQERQRASLDLNPTKVKPMRSAYHFFVDDMQDKLREVSLEEVRRTSGKEEVDVYLLNSNLNGRLIKVWEELEEDARDPYVKKEEKDRHRFMADDEVASRHCATLTARARSPRLALMGKKESSVKSEDDDDDDYDDRRDDASQGEEEDENSQVEPEDQKSSSVKDELEESTDGKKRMSPTDTESPTKKSRKEEGDKE